MPKANARVYYDQKPLEIAPGRDPFSDYNVHAAFDLYAPTLGRALQAAILRPPPGCDGRGFRLEWYAGNDVPQVFRVSPVPAASLSAKAKAEGASDQLPVVMPWPGLG